MRVPPVYRRWVTCPEPRPQASLRLFCFHFAGGDASIFRLWTTQLPSFIEVCPIELPGRATRRGEAPITHFTELIEKLSGMMRPFLNQLPAAFFGHSFGGNIAFELTRLLRRTGEPMPLRLFLAASPALFVRPQLPPPVSHLPDSEFLARIGSRYRLPQEVLASEDFQQEVLPALRADMSVAESYHYTREPPLEVPISAFGAEGDPEVSPAEAQAWCRETNVGFRLRMLPSNDHFFVSTERRRLHQGIIEDLQGLGG